MNKEVKTLGYLLKQYTDSQCYDQYVPLSWLKEQIEKKEKEISKENELHCYSVIEGLHVVLSLLEDK